MPVFLVCAALSQYLFFMLHSVSCMPARMHTIPTFSLSCLCPSSVLHLPQYLFFMLHSASCMFWYIARMEGFSQESWVGQSYQQLVDRPTYVQYIFSLYFCITTFTTVGYGDLKPFSVSQEYLARPVLCFDAKSRQNPRRIQT